jgi:hypothetical protein
MEISNLLLQFMQPVTSYKLIEYANHKLFDEIESTVCLVFPLPKDAPWKIHNASDYKRMRGGYSEVCVREDKDKNLIVDDSYYNPKFLEIPKPKFTKLRWIREDTDSSEGGFAALFLGTIRRCETNLLLIGDWQDQSFDLTSCVHMPQHIKKFIKNEQYSLFGIH